MTTTLGASLPHDPTLDRPPNRWVKRIVIALLIVLGAAGVVFAAGLWWLPYVNAHHAIRNVLVDPQSATFKNEKPAALGGVCGWVNARNRMGGYVGFRPYLTTGDGAALISPVDADFTGMSEGGTSDLRTACMFVEVWTVNCGPSPFDTDTVRRCAEAAK